MDGGRLDDKPNGCVSVGGIRGFTLRVEGKPPRIDLDLRCLLGGLLLLLLL